MHGIARRPEILRKFNKLKKIFTNSFSSDQKPDRRRLLFHLYTQEILSNDKVIPNVRPNQGTIFCDSLTQIQGGERKAGGGCSPFAFCFRIRTAPSSLNQEPSIMILSSTIVVIFPKGMNILVLQIEKQMPLCFAWDHCEQFSNLECDNAEEN